MNLQDLTFFITIFLHYEPKIGKQEHFVNKISCLSK